MKQRVISATIFVLAMLGGIFGGAKTFFLLFALITTGCLWELTGLLFGDENNHLTLRKSIGTLLGALPFVMYGSEIILFPKSLLRLPFLSENSEISGLPPEIGVWLLLALFLLFVLELFLTSNRPFANLAYYSLGLVYLGIPFTLLISIAHVEGEYVPLRVLGLLLLTWTNDTMAYFIGSQLGKRPFFSRISPKKTWEGTLGGIVFTFIVAWLVSHRVRDFDTGEWLLLATCVAVFGTLGDLVESMLKRSVKIKDSGSLMPGHGGLLDRFDSFIFVLPFAWLALLIFGAN